MFRNGKRFIISFTAAIILFMVSVVGIANHSEANAGMNYAFITSSSAALENYISGGSVALGAVESDLADIRLSQQVTVTNQRGFMSVGGTITRSEDEFYPGTYVVKFSINAVMNLSARVSVKMDVDPGETVHVLTGNKNSGYREYTTVTAGENGMVIFDTKVLRDYTISTTDIQGAQKAMEMLLASK